MSKSICINGLIFSVVTVSEIDGYFSVSREYDLCYQNQVISKKLRSLKECYLAGWEYAEDIRQKEGKL